MVAAHLYPDNGGKYEQRFQSYLQLKKQTNKKHHRMFMSQPTFNE